jgi:hypothetical protein
MRFAVVVVAAGARAGAEVVPARGQMATTLGFHIILACLGIAFPTIVLLAEFVGLRRSNVVALTLARRWSQAMWVLVAVGAVTGTVLSFEMGLLWPGPDAPVRAVLGFPFGVEGLFFFLEAIFTAIYLYGWRRLPGWAHFWTGVPIAVSGIFGAMSVIASDRSRKRPATRWPPGSPGQRPASCSGTVGCPSPAVPHRRRVPPGLLPLSSKRAFIPANDGGDGVSCRQGRRPSSLPASG